MSIWGHRVSVRVIATAVVVLMLGALAVAVTRPTPRQVVLVARGMAFYAENGDIPNPTITARAGERIRIVLRNEDRGILHDFAIPATRAALDPVGWTDSGVVTFDAPDQPGTYEYVCRPHMLMMHGKIVVQE